MLTIFEGWRFLDMQQNGLGVVGWLTFWDMETTLPWLLLLLVPVLASKSYRRQAPPIQSPQSTGASNVTRWQTVLFALIVFCVALAGSWMIGRRPITVQSQWESVDVAFADLPPAYHDEHSYLLQARTFLAGRLSWPGMKVRPDLFHQFHVLNEHRTISRYFPWTGLWIAPFEALGHPIYGHWFAGALSAMFFFLALQQIVSSRIALLAGLLIGISPGIAVFSNLLLAHHPTMLALSVFTWAFFRMMTTRQLRFALIAGVGLTLAMLGRPMTAAGYGLPFGIWLAVQLVRDRASRRLTIGFAMPLVIGFLALGAMNQAGTGSWKRSAYQEYTERYTPRHRYGFNNAVGNEPGAGPPAVQTYDQWATNLTPEVAAENVWQRLVASMVWSLAIAPIVFGVLMTFPQLIARRRDTSSESGTVQLRLLAAAVLTLHVVHIPYWFDGIMHWHYVFETAPLLLILTAVGLGRCHPTLQAVVGRRMASVWLAAFVVAGLLPGWLVLPPFNGMSKTSGAVSELAFSRGRFEEFRLGLQQLESPKPVLILIDEIGADVQLSYIINPPSYRSGALVCRLPESDAEIDELQQAYPDRALYVFTPPSQTSAGYRPGTFTPVPE